MVVRVKAEHGAAKQVCRARFDHADVHITVLDGAGKIACLKGSPHALPFARRHLAAKHQPFGTPAHRRVQRAHPDIAFCQWRQGFVADFAAAGGRDPERGGGSGVHGGIMPRTLRTGESTHLGRESDMRSRPIRSRSTPTDLGCEPYAQALGRDLVRHVVAALLLGLLAALVLARLPGLAPGGRYLPVAATGLAAGALLLLALHGRLRATHPHARFGAANSSSARARSTPNRSSDASSER